MGTTSVVRVPGDYQIVARSGGVVIDVTTTSTLRAANTGTVTIYGDLNVIGSTTYINSTNTNILDNILILNSGETNEYVTLGTAGIAVSRGSISTLTNAATLLYDDTVYWSYDNNTSFRGIWEAAVGSGNLERSPTAVRMAAIRVGANSNSFNIFGQDNPLAVINVKGTTDYEQHVLDDDDIPNKKYVDDRVFNGNELARKLKVGETQIELRSNTVVPSDPYYNVSDKVVVSLGTTTNVVLQLEGQQAIFNGLTLNDTEIRTNQYSGNVNISVTPNSTGTFIVNSVLSLTNSTPGNAVQGKTQVYSTATIGGGGTGLYFVNTEQADELVSRKRAIIYGIIF